MTIYEIKRLTAETSPYFFATKTMRFFGQTMKSFKVQKQPDGRFKISAPMKDNGRIMGTTTRFFNPNTNTLELN